MKNEDDRRVGYAILAGFIALWVMLALAGAQAAHGTSSGEHPRGTMDGVNTTFQLNFQPAPWGSIHCYLNGLRLDRNYDFVLGGPNMSQIQFALPATAPTIVIPQPGDVLVVDYTY